MSEKQYKIKSEESSSTPLNNLTITMEGITEFRFDNNCNTEVEVRRDGFKHGTILIDQIKSKNMAKVVLNKAELKAFGELLIRFSNFLEEGGN